MPVRTDGPFAWEHESKRHEVLRLLFCVGVAQAICRSVDCHVLQRSIKSMTGYSNSIRNFGNFVFGFVAIVSDIIQQYKYIILVLLYPT